MPKAIKTLPAGECRSGDLAGVDRAVVQDQHDRSLGLATWVRPITPVEFAEKRDEVCAAFGPTGVDDKVAIFPVEHAEQRNLGSLSGRWDAQVSADLCPDMSQILPGAFCGNCLRLAVRVFFRPNNPGRLFSLCPERMRRGRSSHLGLGFNISSGPERVAPIGTGETNEHSDGEFW